MKNLANWNPLSCKLFVEAATCKQIIYFNKKTSNDYINGSFRYLYHCKWHRQNFIAKQNLFF